MIDVKKDLKRNIVYEMGVDGSISTQNVCDGNVTMLARMVEWFKTRRLSRRSSGSAGSNPASRIFLSL